MEGDSFDLRLPSGRKAAPASPSSARLQNRQASLKARGACLPGTRLRAPGPEGAPGGNLRSPRAGIRRSRQLSRARRSCAKRNLPSSRSAGAAAHLAGAGRVLVRLLACPPSLGGASGAEPGPWEQRALRGEAEEEFRRAEPHLRRRSRLRHLPCPPRLEQNVARPAPARRLRAESHWPRRVAVTPLSLLEGRLPARAAEGSGAPAKKQPCARPRQERTGVALRRGSPSGRLVVRGAGGRGCRRGCSLRGRRSCRSPRGPSSLLRGAARSPRGTAGCGRCGEKGCLVTRWLPEGESMEGGPDSPEGSLPQPPSLVLPLF